VQLGKEADEIGIEADGVSFETGDEYHLRVNEILSVRAYVVGCCIKIVVDETSSTQSLAIDTAW